MHAPTTVCLRVLVLAAVAALPLAHHAHAAEETPGAAPSAYLDLSRATVLVSPGTPRGLTAFLPDAARPEPPRWPLPAGDVLVLALPSDPLARSLADVFSLEVEEEDLQGGYRVRAWRDGDRAVALVYGADPAALYAARFELESLEPREARARSLDFSRPNEEAITAVRAGERVVRPRYAVRALVPGAHLRDADAAAVAGARGNRVWLDPQALGDERIRALIPRLREQGVVPVIALVPATGAGQAAAAIATDLADRMRPWQTRAGVRHFAVRFRQPRNALRRMAEHIQRTGSHRPAQELAEREREVSTALAAALRPAGLEELVVVPVFRSDRLAERFGPPPDLSAVPEAVVAWCGPYERSATVPLTAARRRVREANGVPVLLLETWAAPFQEAPQSHHVPALPRGRDPALSEVLAGVAVLGTRGTAAILEAAWSLEDAAEHDGADLLDPLLPLSEKDDTVFLQTLADRLEAEAQASAGLVPWMRPLATRLRHEVEGLQGLATLRVPVVPRGVHPDGRIDEASWAHGRELPTPFPGVRILVLSDGWRLWFAFRVREREVSWRSVPTLRIGGPLVGPAGRPPRAVIYLTSNGVELDPSVGTVAEARSDTERTFEISLNRFALDGDAHAGRVIPIGLVEMGPASMRDPAPPSTHETGPVRALVVGP